MPLIISEIEINGRWVNQDEIPNEKLQEILLKVMTRAANNIGRKVKKTA